MYDKCLARFVSCTAFFKPPSSKQNHKTFKTGPSYHDFYVTIDAKLSINSVYSAYYGIMWDYLGPCRVVYCYVGLHMAMWAYVQLCRVIYGYVILCSSV